MALQRFGGSSGRRVVAGGLACVVLLLVPWTAMTFLGAGNLLGFAQAETASLDRSDDVVARGLIMHTEEVRPARNAQAERAVADGEVGEVMLNNWTYTFSRGN